MGTTGNLTELRKTGRDCYIQCDKDALFRAGFVKWNPEGANPNNELSARWSQFRVKISASPTYDA